MASERMESEISSRMRTLDSGLSMLAIISSVAPFLGLLGTVWGIMDSFFEIGNQGNASLPVVAPGIAEALITTIVGLVVAIPAVFFYNHFVHSVERIEDELYEAKDMLLLRLRRNIFKLLYGGTPKTSSAHEPFDNTSA
jgi:biopolymer transport protein TolQ